MIEWPPRDCITHIYEGRMRYGKTPDGIFPGVTSALKVLGLSTEGLVSWSARVEREACLNAAAHEFQAAALHKSVEGFRAAVEKRLGAERASNKKLEEAADIGTMAHARVAWHLQRQIGEDPGPKPVMNEAALRAFDSWLDWWQTSGVKPIRVEQPLWHPIHGYQGTADLIGERDGKVGVWDFKSGAGIYLEYHLQVTAYMVAARQWDPRISFGEVVRLPKKAGETFDPKRDVETVGRWKYGKRQMTEEQMFKAFNNALELWKLLVSKDPAFALKEESDVRSGSADGGSAQTAGAGSDQPEHDRGVRAGKSSTPSGEPAGTEGTLGL